MATKTKGSGWTIQTKNLIIDTKTIKQIRGELEAQVRIVLADRTLHKKTTNIMEVLDSLREGVKAAEMVKLWKDIPFDSSQISLALGMSERTLARLRLTPEKKLSPTVSERIVKIAAAKERAVEVFEDPMKANKWLSSPSVALGGRAPLDLMQFDIGIDLVMKELGRIEHGVIS